jgi:sugar O-acyltransferase (sialic acid O-acetyltransferase NeuD family)|tara:strand:+ start:561 stop:1202 length:642 start_codon:yes stop_codon:yes gene_type:complete
MKTLLVYGAGGFGLEILHIFKTSYNEVYKEIVFVDDLKSISNNKELNSYTIITLDNALIKYNKSNADFIIAVANPKQRADLFDTVIKKNFSITTLKDKTAIIRDTAVIEKGSVICAQCYIGPSVLVKKNSLIHGQVLLGHDTIVGKNTSVYCNVSILGGVEIGNNVEIGTGTNIHPNCKVGDNSKIAMGSTVYKDVESNSLAQGNPARVIKKY